MKRRMALWTALLVGATGAAAGALAWRWPAAGERARVALSRRTDSPLVRGKEPARGIAIRWLPATVKRFERELKRAGAVHGVDPEMLAIVTLVESGGWVAARSRSGAQGLMQIMPATGKAIADERGIADHALSKLDEPSYNIDFGAWYLGRLLAQFNTDDAGETVKRAACAYNGGPTHFTRHLAGDAELSDQTKRYRHWVGSMWSERREERSATFEEWLAAGGDRLVALAVKEMSARPVAEGRPPAVDASSSAKRKRSSKRASRKKAAKNEPPATKP